MTKLPQALKAPERVARLLVSDAREVPEEVGWKAGSVQVCKASNGVTRLVNGRDLNMQKLVQNVGCHREAALAGERHVAWMNKLGLWGACRL
jgi:hypothetical protein